MTPTAFAWSVLDMGDYHPPVPRRGERYGPDGQCWLCGGPTGGVGWHFADAIPPTYTNHTLAACPTSRTVCQPCAAMGSKDTWEAYGRAHPEMGLKTGHAMSWRCYSQLFAAPHHHECPTRARWREILLDPPAPPFLAVIAESGQKHLIFRASIAHSRDLFPVQFEERLIWLDLDSFRPCLAAFEALYNLGFSKDSILAGQYHHGQMLKVGLATWRKAEELFAPWRRLPHLAQLAAFVAQRDPDFGLPEREPDIDRPDIEKEEERIECTEASTAPPPAQGQLSLW
jgi:hypothetical protein